MLEKSLCLKTIQGELAEEATLQQLSIDLREKQNGVGSDRNQRMDIDRYVGVSKASCSFWKRKKQTSSTRVTNF